MIWQTYTYDYETPGSYFGAKKACEPLHIQKNLPTNEVVVINTTLHEYKSLTVSATYVDVNGRFLYWKEGQFHARANKLTPCFLPTPVYLPALYLVRLELKDRKGNVLSINDYWETNGQEDAYLALSKLPKVHLQINTKQVKNKLHVELFNPSLTIAAGIKLNVVDRTTGEIRLPIYASDGYINLLAKEKRVLEIDLNGENPDNYHVVIE